MASLMDQMNQAITGANGASRVAPNKNPVFALDGGVPKYGGTISTPHELYNTAYSQLIRGTMSFSKDKLQELDPSYTGYTHIFVLRMPPFMTAIANGRCVDTSETPIARDHCQNLKVFLEMGSTSYSGTPDLTLNNSEVNTGFSGRSYPAPTFSAYDGKSFTIRCLETRGEPVRRGIEYYINGITDANVKATSMHGAMNDDKSDLMTPTLANFTFSIMVVQTDQTLLKIQDVSVWNSCIITGIDRSTLDWENGSIDIVQPRDVAFNGVYMPDCHNADVYKMANVLLGQRLKYYKRFQDMSAADIGSNAWANTTSAF